MDLLNVEGKGLVSLVSDPPRPGVFVLRAVGDIALIAQAAALEQHVCHHPFEDVAVFIGSADLAFGNLGMAICSKGLTLWQHAGARCRA